MATRQRSRKASRTPKTYFAPPERASPKDLQAAIALASHNPIIDMVMQAFGGLVAVLNDKRQILAVNHALLAALGIEDANVALGLRPGEAVGCVHADGPGGCGTGKFCSTCGAVIAIVTALETGEPQERDCVLTVLRAGKNLDVDFAVRCTSIEMEGTRLLLLFLRDVSEEKRRGALERTFFHDVSNLVSSMSVAADLLAGSYREDDVVRKLSRSVALLIKEIDVQRVLSHAAEGQSPFMAQETSVHRLLASLQLIYATHPAASGRFLRVDKPAADLGLTTDPSLVLRILMNMVTNALEAAPLGDKVVVGARAAKDGAIFSVWNGQVIPPDVARRVFQRYFTTKRGYGRGLGTFAMKWLAETYLDGEASFTSTAKEGTTFLLRIPQHLKRPAAGP